jgi:hypothetical protein
MLRSRRIEATLTILLCRVSGEKATQFWKTAAAYIASIFAATIGVLMYFRSTSFADAL